MPGEEDAAPEAAPAGKKKGKVLLWASLGAVPVVLIGLAAALVMAFFEKGLLTVAVTACAAVFAAEWVMFSFLS